MSEWRVKEVQTYALGGGMSNNNNNNNISITLPQ
jgi:hypothetical protein